MVYGLIYRAYLKDGRSYIGQTTQTLVKRQRIHRTKSKTGTTHFENALRKYGFDDFVWEVLEGCNSKEELDEAERRWIVKFDSIKEGFNLKSGGSYGKHSEETKEKLRQSKIGKKNPAYGKPSWSRGKKLSKEHCENLSNSHMGQIAWNKGLSKEQQPHYGKNRSKRCREKISAANKGSGNGMSRLTEDVVLSARKDYETGKYKIKDLADKYSTSRGHMSNIINNKAWIV